ncbi:helix-turn-helix transcriptional regulator [Kitasatospora sp. CM 4170]|uniref:Helix-turn-helix domain-containing protein n=1 Tax=Kitasatospora aburaviensis TaxID=67265 RepID=A0ABW1ESU4_9ACTN|nr:helix-turn-helix transcriptional regulator [Kitasatospora sp. CM 4170]WNM44525.1 helix-turn-helix transcriptional regulator [Kitasatospora sp. CM 4170]
MHRNHATAPDAAGAPPVERPPAEAPPVPAPPAAVPPVAVPSATAPPELLWRAFGARLRHWRRRAGLTQAQLGAAIGYDHTAVSKLEHGTRRAAPRLAARLDDLLAADGDLRAACRRAEEWDREAPAAPADWARPPLPGTPGAGPRPRPAPPLVPPPLVVHPPSRLPDYGLLCPLHGADGCAVPAPADAVALHAVFCAADPDTAPPLDADTAHALAGLLAARLRAGETPAVPGTAAVEETLRAVLRRLARTRSARARRPLARLAAEYAHAAGGLRMQDGRNATAMACFDRALTWAELADDPATQVAALSDMSTLARLDGDPAAALGYAVEIGRAAPGRHWAGAMSQVGRARAYALAGDVRATVRHIARARLHLDHIGEHDESDAPWLSIASMRLRVESGAAAALRDAAVAVDDPRLALRAVDAAGTALRLLAPDQLPTARLLFTIRIADCHLCAHDPRTAAELVGPLLEDAAALPALVRHELRGLHRRLAAAGLAGS